MPGDNSTPLNTKAQHFIPRFYLKGFTDRNGEVWVCEKFKPIRKSRPKEEAHRPDYYTDTADGKRNETAENALKRVESVAAPIIVTLANPQYTFTPEREAAVMVFVASMFVRVPAWRDYLDQKAAEVRKDALLKYAQDKEKFYKMCDSFEAEKGKPLGVDREGLRQEYLKGYWEVRQTSRGFNLASMFQTGISAIRELGDFGSEVLYAPPGSHFVTSDSPVSTIHHPPGGRYSNLGVGFGWPGVEVYFPLNKKACLRMQRGIGQLKKHVDARRVAYTNKITMATATCHLFLSWLSVKWRSGVLR